MAWYFVKWNSSLHNLNASDLVIIATLRTQTYFKRQQEIGLRSKARSLQALICSGQHTIRCKNGFLLYRWIIKMATWTDSRELVVGKLFNETSGQGKNISLLRIIQFVWLEGFTLRADKRQWDSNWIFLLCSNTSPFYQTTVVRLILATREASTFQVSRWVK